MKCIANSPQIPRMLRYLYPLNLLPKRGPVARSVFTGDADLYSHSCQRSLSPSKSPRKKLNKKRPSTYSECASSFSKTCKEKLMCWDCRYRGRMLVVEGEFRVRGCARRLAWGGAHVGEGCVIAWRNLRMGEFMGGGGRWWKGLGGMGVGGCVGEGLV